MGETEKEMPSGINCYEQKCNIVINTVKNGDWSHLAQDKFQWRFPVTIYFAFRIRKMKEISFTSFRKYKLDEEHCVIGVIWTLIIFRLIIIKLCLLILYNFRK
jgi:hypothetical protein